MDYTFYDGKKPHINPEDSVQEECEMTIKYDAVNHPLHYTQSRIECIDAIEELCNDVGQFEGYLKGQVLKYLWRYQHKNGAEDLKKARWYLDKLISLYDSQKG